MVHIVTEPPGYAGGYMEFPSRDTNDEQEPILNRFSTIITHKNDFPLAKATLYDAGVPDESTMQNVPQVGVASTWWEGDASSAHLLGLVNATKSSIQTQNFLAWCYNSITVSSGIVTDNLGTSFSLQSREIIADGIETVTCAHAHDACVVIAGCDEDIAGCVMGIIRHKRPSIVIYGGISENSYIKKWSMSVDMGMPSEARGTHITRKLEGQSGQTKNTADRVIGDSENTVIPGSGGYAGMYTTNSMAVVVETLGLSVAGSSSSLASSPAKLKECNTTGSAVRAVLEKNIRSPDVLTRASFENAIVMLMALGGSTNSVLHTLALARTADVDITLSDFQRISSKTPFIANLGPNGQQPLADLYKIGGTPSVMKLLIAAGLLDGTTLTVTGKTLGENVASWPSLPQDQTMIRPLSNPINPSGLIKIVRGNIAPGGAVGKFDSTQSTSFTGKARVFDKEATLWQALTDGQIPRDTNTVLVLRYQGPVGGPGMPELSRIPRMLTVGGYANVALITDGRLSDISHGFIIGHIVPEAATGGPIAIVEDDEVITIDTKQNSIGMPDVSDLEIYQRLKSWKKPQRAITKGTLSKYARLVGSAAEGAVTDQF